jgi:hypothetical protein
MFKLTNEPVAGSNSNSSYKPPIHDVNAPKYHDLTTLLRAENGIFGSRNPDKAPHKPEANPLKTKNQPQPTTTPGKTRRVVFSTAKWSVLAS